MELDVIIRALATIVGFLDMTLNHCPTESGCIGYGQTDPSIGIAVGEMYHNEDAIGAEVMLRRDFRHSFGPFGTAAGISIGEDDSAWVGLGLTYEIRVDGPFFVEFYAMPGLMMDGALTSGGSLKFRTGGEAGWQFDNGVRVGVAYDHRSASTAYDPNPGLETLMFQVTIPR